MARTVLDMAQCANCGTQIPNGANVCPNCGAAAPQGQPNTAQQTIDKAINTADYTSQFSPADIAENKGISILAYFGILLLIPLLAKPNSAYAKFHCNQGLLLLIFNVAVGIVSAIPVLGWIVGGIAGILSFVFFIMGIINAAGGKAKELPLFGKFRLLK